MSRLVLSCYFHLAQHGENRRWRHVGNRQRSDAWIGIGCQCRLDLVGRDSRPTLRVLFLPFESNGLERVGRAQDGSQLLDLALLTRIEPVSQ